MRVFKHGVIARAAGRRGAAPRARARAAAAPHAAAVHAEGGGARGTRFVKCSRILPSGFHVVARAGLAGARVAPGCRRARWLTGAHRRRRRRRARARSALAGRCTAAPLAKISRAECSLAQRQRVHAQQPTRASSLRHRQRSKRRSSAAAHLRVLPLCAHAHCPRQVTPHQPASTTGALSSACCARAPSR
jgi:hypothetical protein